MGRRVRRLPWARKIVRKSVLKLLSSQDLAAAWVCGVRTEVGVKVWWEPLRVQALSRLVR